MKRTVKNIVPFLPLLLFPLLVVPYSLLNTNVLVDRFGCGCPKIDPFTGEMIASCFNANDFTALFWSVITVIATVLSAILARKCTAKWMRIVFPAAVFIIGAGLSLFLYRSMMWN